MKQISIPFFMLLLFTTSGRAQMTVPAKVYCAPGDVGHIYAFNTGRMPQFVGGDSALQAYVKQNLVPDEKLKKRADGKVVGVQFDIDTAGKIWNIKLSKRHDKDPATDPDDAEINDLVVKLICNMPNWIPGGEAKFGEPGSRNLNIRLLADVHFGKREGSVEIPPSFILLKLPEGKARQPEEEIPLDVFSFAEQMPEPAVSFQKYTQDSIHYPQVEKGAGIQGTVYVSFVVEKDGTITNVEVVKSIGGTPALSAEAVRVVSSMPAWKPGMMNGKPVRVAMTQPVKFVIK